MVVKLSGLLEQLVAKANRRFLANKFGNAEVSYYEYRYSLEGLPPETCSRGRNPSLGETAARQKPGLSQTVCFGTKPRFCFTVQRAAGAHVI